MMADLKMILKDNGFQFFLENIKCSKLKSALKSGIRKSLNIIKKKAISNLKQVQFKKGHLDVNKQIKFKNSNGSEYTLPPFKKGIMVKVFKDGSGGRAEIIGKGNNYNLILPMIENGKGTRYTKGSSNGLFKTARKSHSTGSISHTFFTTAVDSTKGDVHNSLQKNLEEAIMKARNKFYK